MIETAPADAEFGAERNLWGFSTLAPFVTALGRCVLEPKRCPCCGTRRGASKAHQQGGCILCAEVFNACYDDALRVLETRPEAPRD